MFWTIGVVARFSCCSFQDCLSESSVKQLTIQFIELSELLVWDVEVANQFSLRSSSWKPHPIVRPNSLLFGLDYLHLLSLRRVQNWKSVTLGERHFCNDIPSFSKNKYKKWRNENGANSYSPLDFLFDLTDISLESWKDQQLFLRAMQKRRPFLASGPFEWMIFQRKVFFITLSFDPTPFSKI